MKGHRKAPDYPCKHCHFGFGSPRSAWNHQQRCKSNPDLLKKLKQRKKRDENAKNGQDEIEEREEKLQQKNLEEEAMGSDNIQTNLQLHSL